MDGAGSNHLGGEAVFGKFQRLTLPRHWSQLWRKAPERVIIDGDKPVTAASLLERTDCLANGLLESGLNRGDRVILSAAASIEAVVAYVSILRAGLVVVPVNTAYKQREVAHILQDAQPRGAIVDSAEMAEWIHDVDRSVQVFRPDTMFEPARSHALDASTPEQVAMICYTSGTTGAPKGAMLLHRNLMASAEAVILAWRWQPEDRLILALPLFHLHGLGVGLNGTLTAGASMILLERFAADAVLDAAQHATLFFGVPTMYQRLIEHSKIENLRHLRLCVSGSAPLPAKLHIDFFDRTGHHILERYGMTETLMNVSHLYDGERRPGTVGYPLPGVEMRLQNGRSGELSLRGPNIFAGYWKNEQATHDVLSDDGWFKTGDVGELDDDGQLRLVARSKELIISGGFNVYPREVEDVLRSAQGVKDAAVVGIPSEAWGETVVAFVEGHFEESEVLATAEDELAAYKRPKVIVRIDSLPRNALGKVTKHVLRDKAIADQILSTVTTKR